MDTGRCPGERKKEVALQLNCIASETLMALITGSQGGNMLERELSIAA